MPAGHAPKTTKSAAMTGTSTRYDHGKSGARPQRAETPRATRAATAPPKKAACTTVWAPWATTLVAKA